MKTTEEMFRTTLAGFQPEHCAAEYRMAAATVCIPVKDGVRRTTAVIDLDYLAKPTVDGRLAVRYRTEKGKKFRVSPMTGVDFAEWDTHACYGKDQDGNWEISVQHHHVEFSDTIEGQVASVHVDMWAREAVRDVYPDGYTSDGPGAIDVTGCGDDYIKDWIDYITTK